MGKQFICDSTTYELAGAADDVIGLPVAIEHLPESIEVNGALLVRRPQFHVSLVCIGQVGLTNYAKEVVASFCEYTKDHPIRFEKFTGELRFVESGERKTLVAMCNIGNLGAFFDQLNERYSTHIEYPPTHITLYTLGGGPGIFLTSQADISSLTTVVSAPVGVELHA